MAKTSAANPVAGHRGPAQLVQLEALRHGLGLGFVVGSGLAALAVLVVVALLPGSASAVHPPGNAHHTLRPMALRPIGQHRSHHWGRAHSRSHTPANGART